MKKLIESIVVFVLSVSIFAGEMTDNKRLFIKGNLKDKALAVSSCKGLEACELSLNALNFCLTYGKDLGEDEDLDLLIVAGVDSLPLVYIDACNYENRKTIANFLIELYITYNAPNVKISILRKASNKNLPMDDFTLLLNDALKTSSKDSLNEDVFKVMLETLAIIGNQDTFYTLFKMLGQEDYSNYKDSIEDTVLALMEASSSSLIGIIQSSKPEELKDIYELCHKKETSKIFSADIAENILSRLNFIYDTILKADEDFITLQLKSFDELVDLGWGRASKTVIKFLNTARREYAMGNIKDEDMCHIIDSVPKLAPVDCVSEYCSYITDMNKLLEERKSIPSDKVVIALVRSLGTIGSKDSFDTLLSMSYYAYSEGVVLESKKSLKALKW